MNQERDKFFLGKIGLNEFDCWQWKFIFTPEKKFFVIWNWAIKQEWWNNFLYYAMWHHEYKKKIVFEMAVSTEIIHPDRLADALFQFLKGKER